VNDTPPLLELPDEVEICARVLNGVICRGTMYRLPNHGPYCFRCGSNQPGVIYVRKAV